MSTHNISLSVYKRKSPKIIPNTIMSAAVGFFILGTQEEFKIDVVYEPSVFEPLKFYCNLFLLYHNMWILMRTDLSQPAGQNMHQPLK